MRLSIYIRRREETTKIEKCPYQFVSNWSTCIEKLHRDFLWSGLGDEFKFHRVKWDKVCSSISSSGLGIRN